MFAHVMVAEFIVSLILLQQTKTSRELIGAIVIASAYIEWMHSYEDDANRKFDGLLFELNSNARETSAKF